MILNVNDVGPPVRACQDALRSVLGDAAANEQNGTYGRAMGEDVTLFRTTVLGVEAVADGLLLDAGTIEALERYMDAARKNQLAQPLTTNAPYDAILFNQGDEGPPILAAQAALRSVLGAVAQNAANGSYGSKTATDVKTLAAKKNMPAPADGRGMSLLVWQVLLGYMNKTNRTKAGQPLRSDVPAGQYVFLRNSEGPPIAAMQAALASILGSASQNKRNAVWGSATTQDLLAARGKGNLTPVGYGDAVDKLTWDWLYSYMNESYQAMARAPLTYDPANPAVEHPGDLGAAIAAVAEDAYSKLAGRWVYNQYRPMAASLWDDFAEDHSDCSSFATLAYKDAGAPDPNGRGFDGYGYTGSMQGRGSPCNPKPGALAFYGPSWSSTSHVAVVDSAASGVVSFGHTPMEHYDSVAYRDDYLGCREYV